MGISSVRVTRPVDGIEGTCLYQAVDPQGELRPGPCVAIVGVIHGNEPVGGRVLDRLAEHVETGLVCGSVLAIRANLEATAAGVRHVDDGVDLNRLWDAATLARLRDRPLDTLCYEEQRVLALAPLVMAADCILDLHSTSRPTAPFVLFRDDQQHARLAAKLGVANLVTGLHENAILPGGLCMNAGLAAGQRSDRLGFTFEAGAHDDAHNTARAWQVAVRLLHLMGLWADPPAVAGDAVPPEVYEVVERFRQAPAETPPYRFVGYEGGEPGAGRRGPARRLHSFEAIEADEVIVRRGRDVVVRAQAPFTMLMPAPDSEPGTDLFYVTQPRHGGLSSGRLLGDDEARSEAGAIERMLDLLADDEMVKGSSWLSFDGRQLLDLCASVIGRTMRLPVGHPHRRITVVGRGAGGGSERERRASQRYRQVMRDAIASGLPVERIQLMRGAPMAWFDSLTSHHMFEVLSLRHGRSAEAEPVQLRVSMRQPHTVSMLIAGDLDLAIETGNVRYVRVALLVEAATIEPDEDSAKVRVVRAGMLSARLVALHAARDLVAALRDEHGHLVRHGALASLRGIDEVTGRDGVMEPRPDKERLALLGEVLYRAQLRLWCDSLRTELMEPVRLRTPRAVGRWLAATLSATGIYDAEAVRALAIRSTGREWVADPEQVEAYAASLLGDQSAEESGVVPLLVRPRRRTLLRQPVLARDVTADNLERWVGWKRFVRGVQIIPDTRGKNLDLAFDDHAMRSRCAEWFSRAGELAEARPGQVMVVVAGDGLNPQRDRLGPSLDLFRAHRELLQDPRVHYLRIQHAQGTHLSWFKDFLFTLQQRPSGQSVALQWEAEHGATVNVVMLAVRRQDELEARAWSLDGWHVHACGVVLANLEGEGGGDYRLGLFTDETRAGLSQELVQFGRAHCNGLLKQAGWRVREPRGAPPSWALEEGMVAQIARWIERVRGWRDEVDPRTGDAADWVARRLGIVDTHLAGALALQMRSDDPVDEVAAALWASVVPWPGPGWRELAEGH